jgi:hypothetical protein
MGDQPRDRSSVSHHDSFRNRSYTVVDGRRERVPGIRSESTASDRSLFDTNRYPDRADVLIKELTLLQAETEVLGTTPLDPAPGYSRALGAIKRMRSSKAREQGSSKTRTLARVGPTMRRSWCRLRTGCSILLADSSGKDEEAGAGYWTIMTRHNNTTIKCIVNSLSYCSGGSPPRFALPRGEPRASKAGRLTYVGQPSRLARKTPLNAKR